MFLSLIDCNQSDRNYIIETHPLHDSGVDEGQCRVQNLLSECLRNFTPNSND